MAVLLQTAGGQAQSLSSGQYEKGNHGAVIDLEKMGLGLSLI
jgi:hypothetical protein